MTHACPKCSSSMDEGFVVDHTHGGALQSSWVGGPPRKSFWTGLKLSGTAKYPVTTYRCTHCGYLESFALPSTED
jgi:hypothetical protein